MWPIWPALAPLLVPLWLVLLPVSLYILRPAKRWTDPVSGPRTRSAGAETDTPGPSRAGTQVAVVVTVACVLTPW